MIKSIINDDVDFYRLGKKIRWDIGDNNDVRIFACYRRKEDLILVNYSAIEYAIANNTVLDIEYFLMHEIRHMFQQEEIDDYENGRPIVIEEDIVKLWIKENDNYHTADTDKDGALRDYFSQDSEIDAYAYSYAIMEYKYGLERIKYLYTPEFNRDRFLELKNEWMKQFELEKLPKQ